MCIDFSDMEHLDVGSFYTICHLTGNLLLRLCNYSRNFVYIWCCQIRRKMREIMVNQATSCDLKDLVNKFIPEVIGKEIEKATFNIYPLQNVFIRKVKILKSPKFDIGKLMEACSLSLSFLYYFVILLLLKEISRYKTEHKLDEPYAMAESESHLNIRK